QPVRGLERRGAAADLVRLCGTHERAAAVYPGGRPGIEACHGARGHSVGPLTYFFGIAGAGVGAAAAGLMRFHTEQVLPSPGLEEKSVGRSPPGLAKQDLRVSPSTSYIPSCFLPLVKPSVMSKSMVLGFLEGSRVIVALKKVWP